MGRVSKHNNMVTFVCLLFTDQLELGTAITNNRIFNIVRVLHAIIICVLDRDFRGVRIASYLRGPFSRVACGIVHMYKQCN